MDRVGVVGYLAAAGIYCHEGDVVYGMDDSDSRNERMVLKAVGHLGDSDHKYNPVTLSQLAAAWPASRTVPIELDEIGAYSYNEGGQLMANASVLPFGGAQGHLRGRGLPSAAEGGPEPAAPAVPFGVWGGAGAGGRARRGGEVVRKGRTRTTT